MVQMTDSCKIWGWSGAGGCFCIFLISDHRKKIYSFFNYDIFRCMHCTVSDLFLYISLVNPTSSFSINNYSPSGAYNNYWSNHNEEHLYQATIWPYYLSVTGNVVSNTVNSWKILSGETTHMVHTLTNIMKEKEINPLENFTSTVSDILETWTWNFSTRINSIVTQVVLNLLFHLIYLH